MAKRAVDPLTPAQIRTIREGLGLTQVEAGELLGGGPRAFQKYESGANSPAAPTANLLRLLETNPGALETLTGKRAKPLDIQGLRPFEVSGDHINALSERKLVILARRILSAEAQAYEIPLSSVHVASNLTAPDGGEDARISWTGGPDRTNFLPGRACLFQIKATDVTPSIAAADVLTKAKILEPTIAEILSVGGFYIMLCNRPYVQKLREQREAAVRKVVRDQGLSIADEQIAFLDADQIATCVNAHPSVATWVLEQTQPGLGGPFRTWSHWAGRSEHERVPYIEDDRLAQLRDHLRAELEKTRSAVRIIGLSGIGKSRLALEALRPTEDDETGKIFLSDLVLYAVEPDAGTTGIKAAVQTLVDLGIRAVVVVDRCSVETHQALLGLVMRAGSKASILTIDHELSGSRSPEIYMLEKAAPAVTEGILDAVAPGLRGEDKRRLVHFAQGYPQLAAMVGQAWLADIPVATATDETLIDRVLIGQRKVGLDKTITVKAATLVGALALIGFRGNVESELDAVLPFSDGLTKSELKTALEDLKQRGVIQLQGRFATLEPRPIAVALAERRWRLWSPETWDELLAGDDAPFASRLAQRLRLINESDIAVEVVQHVCRPGGPLDAPAAIGRLSNAEVIANFAEIDSRAVADLLDRVLGKLSRAELHGIEGDVRRRIVRAVEKIAFVPDTFEDGANLMMALALAENERWTNNATGQFVGMFPVMLGETAADGPARLEMLDTALAANDHEQDLLVISALSEGIKTVHFSRMLGSESHGLRPAYQPWQPATNKEVFDYISGCFERLLHLTFSGGIAGDKAKQALATEFRALSSRGFLDLVENAVQQVTAADNRNWTEAISSLGDALIYDREGMDPATEARLRALMALLSPDSLENRVQLLVTEMPWDYPCDEALDFEVRERRQREIIEELVVDLLNQPDELRNVIRRISAGRHRMAVAFGRALAAKAPDPLKWTRPILMAFRRAPEGERNGDLVAGYYVGLHSREPEIVESFKTSALQSRVFARLVPYISLVIGITATDVAQVLEAVKSGVLSPLTLHTWGMGGVLAKLTPDVVAALFSELLSGDGEAWHVAVNLVGMFVHSDITQLRSLRPQVRLMAETSNVRANRSDTMADHHFGQIMSSVLGWGRGDEDAEAVALALAKAIVKQAEDIGFVGDHRVTPLIPLLLKDYPDVVWLFVSNAIVADPASSWRFEFALSQSDVTTGTKTSALLNLQPDALFAWCHANPNAGPAFVAKSIPILGGRNDNGDQLLHPLIIRLLDEFGERDDVQRSLVSNIYTFGWSGSTADYYRQYLVPMRELTHHPKPAVRRWAKQILNGLKKQIEADKEEDAERDAFWDN